MSRLPFAKIYQSTPAKHDMARLSRVTIGLGLGLALLTACQTVQNSGEAIGYRQDRFEQIQAMKDFRACHDEALQLDEQAKQSGQVAQYLASARLLESCERNLGSQARQVAMEERMQSYALSIQNYLKGGDIAKARANLDAFKSAFNGKDLYYADRSSFIDTMELLLSRIDGGDPHQIAMLNARKTVKEEMRRQHFWAEN